MTLPFNRNTNYAQGSQVKSADLNALQDWLIASEARFLDDFYYYSTAEADRYTETIDGAGDATRADPHTLVLTTGTGSGEGALVSSIAKVKFGTPGTVLRCGLKFVSALTSRNDDVLVILSADFWGFDRSTGSSNNIKVKYVKTTGGAAEVDSGFAPTADTWYYCTIAVLSTTSFFWSISTDPVAQVGGASGTQTIVSDTLAAVTGKIDLSVQTNTPASRTLHIDFIDVWHAR